MWKLSTSSSFGNLTNINNCQCTAGPRTPTTLSKNGKPTDVKEVNLWHLHCDFARTAKLVAACSQEGRRQPPRGDKKYASSYTVHTLSAPPNQARFSACPRSTATPPASRGARRARRETSPSQDECQAASPNGTFAPDGSRSTHDRQS